MSSDVDPHNSASADVLGLATHRSPILYSTEDAEFRAGVDDPHGPAGAILSQKRPKLGFFFWVCVAWVAIIILLAILAGVLPLENPHNNPFIPIWGGPSWSHWLGTDSQGRDILSRVIFGSRVSLVVGFGATAIGLSLGGGLGMFAAWRRGVADLAISFVMLLLFSIPALVILIALATFWIPQETWKLVIEIGILSCPLFYRVMRTATLSVATRDYVQIATLQGASTRRIVFKELLPNVYPIAVSYFIIGIAGVIVLEGTLAFLGLSISPNINPSWGNMIAASVSYYPTSVWLFASPAIDMCLFLLALNFIGDRLRTYFEVTEAKLT